MLRTVFTLVALPALLAAAAPALAGGGILPGGPVVKVVGPVLTGSLVLDPHEAGVTGTARQASLTLRKGSSSASAVFDIDGTFLCGCDLGLTSLRFVGKELTKIVPETVVEDLLGALAIQVPVSKSGIPGTPIITDVDQARCTGDPLPLLSQIGTCTVPGAIEFNQQMSVPGIFSAEFVVQFAFFE